MFIIVPEMDAALPEMDALLALPEMDAALMAYRVGSCRCCCCCWLTLCAVTCIATEGQFLKTKYTYSRNPKDGTTPPRERNCSQRILLKRSGRAHTVTTGRRKTGGGGGRGMRAAGTPRASERGTRGENRRAERGGVDNVCAEGLTARLTSASGREV